MMKIFQEWLEPKDQIPESWKRFGNSELKALIIPILIEQFLALLVGIADTLMVSYAGETAVSGVSLVNQLNNVFIMVFTALASGGAIIASQYVGKGDRESGVRSASQLLMITTLISLAAVILVIGFGSGIFGLLFGRVEEEVHEAGMLYLFLSALSYPFLALYNACGGLFRSMSKTKALMNVSIAMNAINVVGNAIGIFVLHAGVAGVAIPSLIARAFAAVVMMYLALQKRNPLYVSWKDVFCWDTAMLKRIFGIAIPNSIENGLFQISKVALSSIVALFGTVQIAANGVAQSFWSMSALFAIAMGPAFITVIGQYMGASDVEGAEYYMKKLLRLTYLGGAAWNLVSLICVPFLLKLYSLSDEGVRLVFWLCVIHNGFNAVMCPVAFALSSGLRAAGDIPFNMYAAIFSTVVCRVLLSLLFGLVLNMGVIGIALAMAGDWTIKAGLTWWRYRSGRWKNFKVI